MAMRLINLFNAHTGTRITDATPTQLVGPTQLRLTHGHRKITSRSDGLIGRASQDRGPFFCEGDLGCEDVTTFMSTIALFEAAATGQRAIGVEGKEVGAATATKVLIKRAALTSARLSLRDGGNYAGVNYGFAVSCDPASDSQDDELAFTEAQTKTTTIGAGKRTYRIISATHAAVQAFLCGGVELNVQGAPAAIVGDGEFGETVEVPDYDVSGRVMIQDFDVAALLTKAQTLIAAAEATLVIVIKQQNNGSNTTLTLANAKFFDVGETYNVGQYAQAALSFGCVALSGTTPYGLANGINKIITMA